MKQNCQGVNKGTLRPYSSVFKVEFVSRYGHMKDTGRKVCTVGKPHHRFFRDKHCNRGAGSQQSSCHAVNEVTDPSTVGCLLKLAYANCIGQSSCKSNNLSVRALSG